MRAEDGRKIAAMRSIPKVSVDAPAGGPDPAGSEAAAAGGADRATQAAPALMEPGVRAAPTRDRARDAAQDWVDLERRLAKEASRRSKSDLLSGAEAQALAEAAAQARTAKAEAERSIDSEAGGVPTRRERREHASAGRLRRLSKVLALVLSVFVLGFVVGRVSTLPGALTGDRAARPASPSSVLKLDRDASAFANRAQSPVREPEPADGGR